MIFQKNRKIWLTLLLITAAFTIYSFVGEQGLWELNKMIHHRNELKTEISVLERDNNSLAEQIGRLRNDQATFEALARTKLGMVRPGEVVYIFPEEEDQKR
ncbi:MAG: septum formation initiator family protein [bacterium]